MEPQNSNELDIVILQLDGLLIDGQQKHRNLLGDYHGLKTSEGFNPENYYQQKYDILNEWYKTVANLLDQNFKLKHRLFHFMHPKVPVGRTIGDMPGNLSNLTVKFEAYLYALEDIILWLEERRNLSVRHEIANIEYQADILYKVTYSDHTREVKLNNLILTKTNFDSENDNCFQYIYRNPNRPIGISELSEAAVGKDGKLKKRLAHIVRDLGFVDELKTIFFPVVQNDQLMFVNPITKQYAFEKELPPINFKKLRSQSKTEEDKVSQDKPM